MRCEACGVERLDLDLADASAAEVARMIDAVDAPGDKIAEAFRAKEWTRFVGLSVGVEGGASARTAATEDGPGWIAVVRGALVFVTVRQIEQEIVIEAPVVRLPQEQRAAVLRAALELCAGGGLSAFACLRDDLVILRARVRLAVVTPSLMRGTLASVGASAASATEMLVASFLARPAALVSEAASLGFDTLGAPRRLAKAIVNAAPIPLEVSRGAPPPPAPAVPSLAPVARPDESSHDDDSLPAILAPLLSTPKKPSIPPPPPAPIVPPLRAPQQPPAAARVAPRPSSDKLPALTLPDATPPEPTPLTAGAPAGRDAVKMFLEDRKRTVKEGGARGASSARASPRSRSRPSRRRPRAVGPARAAVRRGRDHAGRSPRRALLKRAELLGAPMMASSSSAGAWLVRAAVFRAVYEFREALPDAVANIYRASGVAKRGVVAEPEAAFAAFERVVAAKAVVVKEKPLLLDPLTTAQQAKEHVGRYIVEIERASTDPGLKHYLALGALCELLVRAKLPAQTSQRLREIIGHAQREGAKASAIDLLMTALKRISA